MDISVYGVVCPDCERLCWVSDDGIDDPAVCEVEAVECPFCEYKWLMREYEDWMPLEHAYVFKAVKNPKDLGNVVID